MRSPAVKATLIVVGLLLVFTFNVCFSSAATQSNQPPLYLSVKLNDPYNPDLRITLPVSPGKPFKVTVENNELQTTISGTPGDPVEGKYPLTITVSEWASTTSNISGTSELHLELDRPLTWGPVSSFVYLRTIQLSNKPPS